MESRRALSRPLCGRSMPSTAYGVPMSLKLGRKVFISHSGKDKDFVCFLHKELCNRYHDSVAFFDQETLPKAEPVSMENILEEARGSKLGVLVLTDHFFMHTPNPMLELQAFVAGEVQLLPLFFTMSVDEFKEKSRIRATWEERWREWSNVDNRVNINEWRRALDLVKTYSGLEYCKTATNQLDFIHKIVNEVTGIIPPGISFSGEGVYGLDRLCQIVNNMYKKCASMHPSNDLTQVASTSTSSDAGGGGSGHALDVVGIYGFAGLGKTTLCKCLCDFYFAEFNGKVCHVDLGSIHDEPSSRTHSSSFKARMQYMLSILTCFNNDGQYMLSNLSLDQVKNVLRSQFSSMKNPIFLAIDNVLPDRELQEEADFYLSCGFPKGSKIFITSRSRGILEILTSQYSSFAPVINHMPSLELQEARDIFVHGIPELRNFGMQNVEDEVNKCVKMCAIHTSYWLSRKEYLHPLMLKSLAAAIRWDRRQSDVAGWKGRLKKLRSEGIADNNDAWKTVFNVLDISYAVLSEEAKTLFLDLALFCIATCNGYARCAWIQRVYSHFNKQKLDEIFLQLQDLCFIEDIKEGSTLSNLMLDFSMYKVSQGINRPHYYVGPVKDWQVDIPPRTARNVSISRCKALRALDLRDMEGLEVLHLVDNSGLQEVLLSRTTSAHLRSLIVTVPPGASLSFIMDEDWSTSGTSFQRCHGGPQWLELEGNIILTTRRERSWLSISSKKVSQSLMLSIQKSLLRYLYLGSITAAPAVCDLGSILGELRNLETLTLKKLPSVQSIDVTTCINLNAINVVQLPSLRFICGLDKSPNLEFLKVAKCKELLALTIPSADGLKYIEILDCRSLERITICTRSSHPEADCRTKRGEIGSRLYMHVGNCPTLKNIDGRLQYTGCLCFGGRQLAYIGTEVFEEMLESAGVDSSLFIGKASLKELKVFQTGVEPAGLAGLQRLALVEVQNTGLLISALWEAQPDYFLRLEICCKEDGSCGCDKNAPNFIPLPGHVGGPWNMRYCCPQVRDLASLAQWHEVRHLNLRGCTSVELWPDFGSMTGLVSLDLSFTSLKEWPAGVQLLPSLGRIKITGCKQLLEEELIKGIITICEQQPMRFVLIASAVESLIGDVTAQRRDRSSVVDALDSYYTELVALFQRADSHVAFHLIQLMYNLWFEEVEANWSQLTSSGDDCCDGLPHNIVRTKMRRLLCSQGFLSLLCMDMLLNSSSMDMRLNWSGDLQAWDLVALIVMVGEAASCKNASVNDDLKESIIAFVKWFSDVKLYDILRNRNSDCGKRLRILRVGAAVCKMARVPSVAAELGQDFVHTIVQALEARVRHDYEETLGGEINKVE